MSPRAAKTTRAATEAGTAGASSRERILKEAERVFGAYGFDGATMRQVAEAAGVPLALVSYHFGSKEGLYRAVFDRRVPTVVEQRLVGLAIAMSEPDLDRRLELVVKALVFPMLHLRAHDRDPSFGRVLAHETMDPISEQRGFIRDMFDPIARAVVDALASALPGRSLQDITPRATISSVASPTSSTNSPPIRATMLPADGRSRPITHFISELLPLPFVPSSATVSPAPTDSETSCKARTWP